MFFTAEELSIPQCSVKYCWTTELLCFHRISSSSLALAAKLQLRSVFADSPISRLRGSPAEGFTDWVVLMYKTSKCFLSTVVADRELIRKDKDMAEYFRKCRNSKFTGDWRLVPRSLLLQGKGRMLGEDGDLEGNGEEEEDAWDVDDAMM